MRRSIVAVALSLLLVLVQHGAVRHALGHLSHSDRTAGTTLAAVPAADAAVCAACESFAQVANPVLAAGESLAVAGARPSPSPEPPHAVAATATLTPRSRGPPSV